MSTMRQVLRCRGGRMSPYGAMSSRVTLSRAARGWSPGVIRDRRIREDRTVEDVARCIEHRPHREVDAVAAQLLEPLAPRHVVQPDLDPRMFGREALDEVRQVEDRRSFAGRDVEFAGVEVPATLCESAGQVVDALDQRRGEFVQRPALRRQRDPGPAALEQHRAHLLLQSPDLQRDRRLAQVDAVRRLGDALRLYGVAERPELLEPVLLVVETPGGHSHDLTGCHRQSGRTRSRSGHGR